MSSSIPAGTANWLITRASAHRLLAGRRYFPLWAVVKHQGRTSGRMLSVPVAITSTSDGFVVPLLFGPRTNWVRNVLAAGGCVIRWRGVDHQVTGPELIEPSEARTFFGPFAWLVSERLVAPEGFLLLRFRDSTSAVAQNAFEPADRPARRGDGGRR